MFERFKRLNKFSLAGQIQSEKIVFAIQLAEEQTSAEIRVHYTTCLSNDDVFTEARKTFESLKMHTTQQRNAVLIFLRLRTKEIAILGVIGIHQHVGNEFWNAVKEEVIQTIKQDNVIRRYRDWETDRKSTRLNSSHLKLSRMPSSA